MSRTAFKCHDSDQGADAALSAVRRNTDDKNCAGRILNALICVLYHSDFRFVGVVVVDKGVSRRRLVVVLSTLRVSAGIQWRLLWIFSG